MTKQGRWSELGRLITDEMLHEFAVVGTPSEAGHALHERFAGIATRLTFYATYESDPQMWPEVLEAVRSAR